MANVNTSGFDTGFVKLKPASTGDAISDAVAQELERRIIVHIEQKAVDQQDVLSLKSQEVPQSITADQSEVVFSWNTPFSNLKYVASVVVTDGGNSGMLLREVARTATSLTFGITGLKTSATVKLNALGV